MRIRVQVRRRKDCLGATDLLGRKIAIEKRKLRVVENMREANTEEVIGLRRGIALLGLRVERGGGLERENKGIRNRHIDNLSETEAGIGGKSLALLSAGTDLLFTDPEVGLLGPAHHAATAESGEM